MHANILETILTGAYLKRDPITETMEYLAAVGVGLLLILFVPMVAASITAVLLVVALGGLGTTRGSSTR